MDGAFFEMNSNRSEDEMELRALRDPIFVCFAAIFLATAIVSTQAQKTIWDGVYTEEQAGRGAKAYADHCAQCHGDTLGGVESAPALTGPAFYANWEGETLNAVFERIRTSMPQDEPGSLSRVQNAEILAHMLRIGGYPTGESPLEGQAAVLSQIKVLTYKP
jgi:mono/diheme cytochrome c family protein